MPELNEEGLNFNEEDDDKRKSYFGIALPQLIAGSFAVILLFLTFWLSQFGGNKKASKCYLRTETNRVVEMIDDVLLDEVLGETDKYVLGAYKEKFELDLLVDDFCENEILLEELSQEIAKVKELLNENQ